jgi:hypothetical protein
MTPKEKVKQTAVEWLVEEITFSERNLYNWMWIKLKTTVQGYNLTKIIEKAKEMEKEQIMEAHGDERDYLTDSGNFITISAEQYYNETYKKEEK